MEIIAWFNRALDTVKEWIKRRGLKNIGWLIAFVVAWFLFDKGDLFYSLGFTALGIFVEKNRKALIEIWKELKSKLPSKK